MLLVSKVHPQYVGWKTYLWSTMTQLDFKNLLVLHVHKERTDTLQLPACLNEFVSGSENRSSLFGTFWVIFSSMFQCLTCISLRNEIGVWEATRSCLSLSNFQIFFWGSMPPRLWHAKPDRFFLLLPTALCGTPDFTSIQEDMLPLTTTLCSLFDKMFQSQISRSPHIPMASSFRSSVVLV